MLILTRKSNEAVVVGGSSGLEQLLKVTVLEVRNSSVKLGFEANTEIPIHRAEVWERIRAANDELSETQPRYRLAHTESD